jgi:sorbitol/mannitol transport system permease protein
MGNTMKVGTVGPQPAESQATPAARIWRRPPERLLLLVPAIAYLALITQAPFIVTLWYSIHKWILDEPDLGQSIVGFDNFTYTVLHDTVFSDSVKNTLVITFSIIGVTLVLGLIFALLLHRPFFGRGFVRALMIAPFFVMPTVNAVVWKNFFLDPILGLFDWLLTELHLTPVDWLTLYPRVSVIAIASWQWTPFMMLILLAGLQGVPDEIREAARIDGTSLVEEFRYITFPLLLRYMELCILLGTVYVLNLFGEIRVATGGGPGTQSTTLTYYTYQTIHDYNDVGDSAALGVLAVIFASVIAAGLLRLLTRTFTAEA